MEEIWELHFNLLPLEHVVLCLFTDGWDLVELSRHRVRLLQQTRNDYWTVMHHLSKLSTVFDPFKERLTLYLNNSFQKASALQRHEKKEKKEKKNLIKRQLYSSKESFSTDETGPSFLISLSSLSRNMELWPQMNYKQSPTERSQAAFRLIRGQSVSNMIRGLSQNVL